MARQGFENLKMDVLDTDLCTRCGGCVGACPVGVLKFGPNGIELDGKCIDCGICSRICPGRGMDMSIHERRLFSRSRKTVRGGRLGIHLERRHLTSSRKEMVKAGYYGGRVTSILVAAMEGGLIQAALLTDWSDPGSLSIGSGVVARTKEEIVRCASSKYVFSSVLSLLSQTASDADIKRVAVVGLPCQVQAVRNMETDQGTKHLTSKIAYLISLNCGAPNMSEEQWRKTASRLMDTSPEKLTSFRYRKVSSARIRLEAGMVDGAKTDREMSMFRFMAIVGKGSHWPRCELCQDYSGELSDLSFGAPVIRTEKGLELIENGIRMGYLKRSSFQKSVSQGVTDLFVGFRKRRSARVNSEKRRRIGLPVPEYR